jgi:opacity protein-like surface antigen
MKIKILLLATAFTASSAFADAPGPVKRTETGVPIYKKNALYKNYYTKIEVGVAVPKAKRGVTGMLGAGYAFNEYLRSDLMFQYNHAHLGKVQEYKQKSNAYAAMLNAYFDAHNKTLATPYLTAGMGIGHTNSKVQLLPEAGAGTGSGKVRKNNFVWNAGLGCQFKLQENLKLDLGYRYTDLGKRGSKTINGKRINLKKFHTNEVLLGLVYNV